MAREKLQDPSVRCERKPKYGEQPPPHSPHPSALHTLILTLHPPHLIAEYAPADTLHAVLGGGEGLKRPWGKVIGGTIEGAEHKPDNTATMAWGTRRGCGEGVRHSTNYKCTPPSSTFMSRYVHPGPMHPSRHAPLTSDLPPPPACSAGRSRGSQRPRWPPPHQQTRLRHPQPRSARL